jgi:16S rRNA (uracil1498-N3)-methyltransferase
MQLPFFYNEEFAEGISVLNEETSRHIAQVLRMKVGEQILLTDGKGKIQTAEITKDHKKATEVRIVSTERKGKSSKRISIAISPIKNTARFEWFLEKATEIGVAEIIPILCERTEKERFRHDRMNNILISAMLQSRQAWMPVLHEPVKFSEVIKQSTYQQKFIAHCIEDEKRTLAEQKLQSTDSIITLIGPEGDFTNAEIKAALDSGYTPVSLGETRLRTETAGLVSVVILNQIV